VPWAQLRLAPQKAWSFSRGDGVTVAIIDSGVDATVPALAGHVTAGIDVTTGSSADSDSVGHGTAMAAIIVAQPCKASLFVGVAPGAVVLPIRVTVDDVAAQTAHIVTAIDVAVTGGAAVIMVGQPISLLDPAVAAAVSAAVSRDVVMVVTARAAGPGDQLGSESSTLDDALPGVLRVGAVAADEQLVGAYPPGAVDVLAPGAGVVSLGANSSGEIHGSGSDFAVAFVAGLAALVRSRFPELSAADTVRHIEKTADHVGTATPDPRYGWGIINPLVAVSGDAIPTPTGTAGPTGGSAHWPLRIALLVIVWTGTAVGIGVLNRRHRTPSQPRGPVRGRHVLAGRDWLRRRTTSHVGR
jgi:subtilisin family serine protease